MFLLEWPGGSWETTLRWSLLTIAAYWLLFWLAVTYWAARDGQMRSGNAAFSAFAVLLVGVGSLPGLAVYLMVRPRSTRRQRYLRSLEEEALEAVLGEEEHCPACKRAIRADYLVCPACITPLKHSCLLCSKPIDQSWQMCPYCLAPANETPAAAAKPIPMARPQPAAARKKTPAAAATTPAPPVAAASESVAS
jgi:hypothetical protein